MKITIFGSTGSIGTQTLNVISQTKCLEIAVLVANKNANLLIEQAHRFKPKRIVLNDESCFSLLKDSLKSLDIDICVGRQAVLESALYPSKYVMSAISGFSGLEPTLLALKRGAIVLLANKESLVCAGELMRQFSSQIIPIDSEHNAIFQILRSLHVDSSVNQLILTASGGPFLKKKQKDLRCVTPEEAIQHPTWSMGKKISVDSATLMNKALEVIEAAYLFKVSSKKISVLIHPQSIVHALVSYIDGSYHACMGPSDMRIAIAYALYQKHKKIKTDILSLSNQNLTFEPVDPVRFPFIRMAYDILNMSNSAAILFNAANEEAVTAFLNKKIGFLDIIRVIEDTVDDQGMCLTLDSIIHMDKIGRDLARKKINSLIK